jgi:glycosylphosphatidylinositol transamidase (GPIT) subunit GPI8/ABC-type branched-subunit amino acid transport system substrate-binding protein
MPAGDNRLKLGVMLTLSGDDDPGYRRPLQWAVDNFNKAGGIGGRPLDLEFFDLNRLDPVETGQKVAQDETLLGVIGPEFSSTTFKVAPFFIDALKPLVSPEATSGELSRAYAGSKYIWRTVEPDVAQVKIQLIIAAQKNPKSISLLTSNDPYGETFFSWFGFFSTEIGLKVMKIVRDNLEDNCAAATAKALEGRPDILVAVPSRVKDSVCIVRSLKNISPQTKVIFADGGRFQGMIDELGPDAEGIEGTVPAPAPYTGFEVVYEMVYHRPAPTYSASMYDAVLLLAYGLARSGGVGGPRLATAMTEIVDSRGAMIPWDKYGIAWGLRAIERAELPNITGATGPLDYDPDFHVDPVATNYAHWRVEKGKFVTIDFYSTKEYARSSESTIGQDAAFRTLASEANKQKLGGEAIAYNPPPKTGLWAFIVAGSSGWKNYRHQADALANYQLLKANGVKDDHIILVMADDISQNELNPDQGIIRNQVSGNNLYQNVKIDYRLSDLSKQDIFDILAGKPHDHLTQVINSSGSQNIFFFWVGHGGQDGIFLDVAEPGEETSDKILGPQQLKETIQQMSEQQKYRRLLMVVETCHGGVMGTQLEGIGALLLSGASPIESSFGENYDPRLDAWLSDKFAYEFQLLAEKEPQITLSELYGKLYYTVPGSHVSVYNNKHFGNTGVVRLQEFLNP